MMRTSPHRSREALQITDINAGFELLYSIARLDRGGAASVARIVKSFCLVLKSLEMQPSAQPEHVPPTSQEFIRH